MSKLMSETKVLLSNVRLSYANIFEPKSIQGSAPKYSVSLIISKDDQETINIIKKGISGAITEGAAKLGIKDGKVPKNLKVPLRDGDEERDDEAYANSMFFNANSNRKPAVVGTKKDAATGRAIQLTEDEVYSGCYANVTVKFYAYNTSGNKGIAAGLGNIQKTKDGPRLGGGASAEEEFEFTEVDLEEEQADLLAFLG